MCTIRPFSIFDTFFFNNINLDIMTETVTNDFNIKLLVNLSLIPLFMENILPNGLNIVL